MYRNLIEGNFYSVYDDVQELLDLLCKGPNVIKPVLPQSKQQELLDEIQIFVENNDMYIKANRTNDIKRAFFDFAFDFLRLESVMRIFSLSGVNTKMTLDPLTKKEIRAILKWESEIKTGITRYLYMPEECDPVRAYKWPLSASDAEYFDAIYGGLLSRYSQRYRDDFRYSNALSYLNSIKHFSRSIGRK